ncbi:sigma-70 family RNA polymerase sigma factor [soil metagenome]
MSSSVEETVRIEGGQILATLIRFTGDFAVAEDAVQDAVVVALETWGDDPPDNPAAWLTVVARNKALDRIRREANRHRKEADANVREIDLQPDADDVLRLMFTCCHPALSPESQVALTLRTISGLSTIEIARAFLVSEATMGQRLSRSRKKIALARIPYRLPRDHELPDRLGAVLAVVYLIFTTGHHAPVGELDQRVDLAEEATRLTRLLAELMPDEPEVAGLLALMLATQARNPARTDEHGEIVLLADQDRTKWDHEAIEAAAALVDGVLRRRRPGPYQVQAAIASLHGLATSDADTDWSQIVDLYRLLEGMTPTAVVRVNRAVAESKVFGPGAGLGLIEDVAGLERWHLLWSTRAELLRQLGRSDEAAAAYRLDLGCEMNDSDRRFIIRRLSDLLGPLGRVTELQATHPLSGPPLGAEPGCP